MSSVIERFRTEGREEGLNDVNALNIRLSNDNRLDDLIQAASDPIYQEQLIQELVLAPADT